jgi:hypothetical protein
MGNDYTRYYGAYFKCLKKNQKVERIEFRCSECNKKYTSPVYCYCPDCGGKVSVVENTIEERISDHFEIREKTNEALQWVYFSYDENLKDYDIYFDDLSDADCGMHVPGYGDNITEFENAEFYISNFTSKYEREAEYLRSQYESVEIKCGYIQCVEK